MRILHIASGDTWGGAESQLCGLIGAFRKYSGVEISAIVLNQGLLTSRLRALGLECLVIDESKHSTLELIRAVKDHIDTVKPDIVHTHGYKQNIVGAIASPFSHRSVCVRTQHGDWEIAGRRFSKSRLFRVMDLLAARFLQHGVVAVSEDLARKLARSLPSSKIRIIENGIDPESIDRNRVRRTDQPTHAGVRVVFIGRMVDVKRVDLFLNAIKVTIDRVDRPVEVDVFGDGPRLIEFQQLSQKLGIDGCVKFHGFVENVTEQLAHSDLLVMTSDHEGMPIVLLEALYLGVPVVAPAVGGIPTVLTRDYGELVCEQSAAAYSQAILNCIARNAELRRTILDAKSKIEEHHSTEKQAGRYREYYQQLLMSR